MYVPLVGRDSCNIPGEGGFAFDHFAPVAQYKQTDKHDGICRCNDVNGEGSAHRDGVQEYTSMD